MHDITLENKFLQTYLDFELKFKDSIETKFFFPITGLESFVQLTKLKVTLYKLNYKLNHSFFHHHITSCTPYRLYNISLGALLIFYVVVKRMHTNLKNAVKRSRC